LPEKFGLVLDRWTSGSRHYVAIFSVYDDGSRLIPRDGNDDYFDDLDYSSRQYFLLAFSPVEAENLFAQSLFDLIADSLPR
jgi:hypothetical protein